LSGLPRLRGRRGHWDLTLIARCYECLKSRFGELDLNEFATLFGAAPSALHARTRGRNLVLWHGTSVARAEKILEHGFAHFKGVWMDEQTGIPFAFAQDRARQFDAKPAICVSVIDLDLFREGQDFYWEAGEHVVVFRHEVPPWVVQYLITSQGIRFVGETRAQGPAIQPRVRFVKRDGGWAVPSQNPVLFRGKEPFRTTGEWLPLFCRHYLTTYGEADPVEIFTAVYASIHPQEAISRKDMLGCLVAHCAGVGGRRALVWSGA
jgi:hypothetical protein